MRYLSATLLLLLATTTSADTLGVYLGAQHWEQAWDGAVRNGGSDVDIDRELGYSDNDGNVLYVHFEHPIPGLPNLRLRRSDVETSGRTRGNVNYDGRSFAAGARSRTDLGHTDITGYYEVLDNVVSLDIGLTVRHFDGEVTVSDGSNEGKTDIDGWIPMGFIGVRADLPLTGLYLGATIDALAIGDSGVEDVQAVVGWESPLGLGLELGYRRFSLDYDDDEEQADLTIDGGFIGLTMHF